MLFSGKVLSMHSTHSIKTKVIYFWYTIIFFSLKDHRNQKNTRNLTVILCTHIWECVH